MNMFPPGRIIFVRPLKQYDDAGKKVDTAWDSVWITPEEIIGEGILISPKVVSSLLLPWSHHMPAPISAAEQRRGITSSIWITPEEITGKGIPISSKARTLLRSAMRWN